MEHIPTNWFNEWPPKEWKTSHNYSWASSLYPVCHLRNRTVAASTTAAGIPGLRKISSQTVCNQLRQHGIGLRRPYFGAVLTPLHRREIVRWYNRLRCWKFRNWRRIWFSDESRFLLQKRDSRIRIYRRRNERFSSSCVQEVDSFRGGNVMMWADISNRPSACPGQFNGCKVQRWNSPTSPHARNWPTEGVIPTGQI